MAESSEPAVEETKTPQKKGRKPKAAAAVEADAKTSEVNFLTEKALYFYFKYILIIMLLLYDFLCFYCSFAIFLFHIFS